ncbi:hypothetical protein CGL56_00305 [Neolewinella marina]|uniref:Uncharacterized protein n=1 Tax=Neolewinella marina TaxID=438751 RepID=A0A2G0CHS5_9BACT|nr:hypothetical protein CGL56_00305 [Neolewinella marina]
MILVEQNDCIVIGSVLPIDGRLVVAQALFAPLVHLCDVFKNLNLDIEESIGGIFMRGRADVRPDVQNGFPTVEV